MTELVTNALSRAFPNGRHGDVYVALRAVGNAVELQVRDNGRGLPPGFSLEQIKTLGLRIVHILAQRLHATVTVEGREGLPAGGGGPRRA